ncbi:MAG: Modification methylase HaeIII [Nitrospira sp.]|nr:Modification methylase HaeIII [Nitrospira sp.]
MSSNLMSVSEVAERLDLSEQHIRGLIRAGKIPADKVGRQWVVPEESLEFFAAPGEIVTDQEVDHARREIGRSGLVALSFFTGAMGLDMGLEKEGIHVLLASEIDKACRETIATNRPDVALIGDIRDYTASEIRDHAGLSAEDEIDLMVGGPPCQAFSSAGKRQGFEDERGNVFLVFLDRILELRPRYAVIENVRGLLSAPLKHRQHDRRGFGYPPLTPDEEKGGALMHIVRTLRAGGYGVSFNLYNAANFGAPQVRERVVMVCFREGDVLPFLAPTRSESGLYGLPPWQTVEETFKGLKEEDQMHVKFPEKRLKYYRMLKPGQYWKDLPKEIQKEAMGASFFAGGGKTGFYRRLAWKKPAPTLVTHPAMPATDLAHPVKDRPLSVQEYKRLQEFPDEMFLAGGLTDQYRQIGNAVPVSLGRAIARHIIAHMRGQEIPSFPDFPYSRYRDTDHVRWERVVKEREQTQRSMQLDLGIEVAPA